jgi:hypothetical protein
VDVRDPDAASPTAIASGLLPTWIGPPIAFQELTSIRVTVLLFSFATQTLP